MSLAAPAVASVAADFPAFEPFPGLSGGHAQTIVARYLPGRLMRDPAVRHELETGDGDRLAVLESTPPAWAASAPSVLLVHGLGGCAESPYVVRVAHRLYECGARVVRMNLRGAGSGFGLARGSYHAGRTGDLRVVAEWMARRAPESPIALVGFSLGANLVLKLAAEAASERLAGLDCVVAANPPLDLSAGCRFLQRPGAKLYDRNFVRLLHEHVRRFESRFPDAPAIDLSKAGTLYDFDNHVTAPRNGFRDAEHYYSESSSGPLLGRIEVDGLVVHALDDPFIPPEPFHSFEFPPRIRLDLQEHGGHLGFLDRRKFGGDRRWLDARITTWLSARWATNPALASTVPSH
ncbi:MAG: alpha/beta fold hydrolase [Isosphaeraceae bacterium]|nr:alpha/beta fold hydrolase [Isosphaeraceae bacterium]